MGMNEYLNSIYWVIERIIGTTLLDTSKNLILYYLEGSERTTLIGKAREAITKYTSREIPSLEEIREKSKTSPMDPLDRLILNLEYESKQFTEERLPKPKKRPSP